MTTEAQRRPATISDYISIMRIDHWFKNIFMLPGLVIAWLAYPPEVNVAFLLRIVTGVFATCLIASANYVINEWLDAPFDRHHPTKKFRASVVADLQGPVVWSLWLGLAVVGLGLGWTISPAFFWTEVWLLVMGILYNVPPFRTKDRIYMDVLSESINNPIRLLLGWYLIVPSALPPSSMIMAYWMGGAFLMATKRYAEYRMIGDPQRAGQYRRSFKFYTERKLLISLFFYAITAAFFLGIFLVKDRIELLLSFPLFALLFAWYLDMAFDEDSAVQHPEKLYHHKKYMAYVVFLSIVVFALFYFDIPALHYLLERTFSLN